MHTDPLGCPITKTNLPCHNTFDHFSNTVDTDSQKGICRPRPGPTFDHFSNTIDTDSQKASRPSQDQT